MADCQHSNDKDAIAVLAQLLKQPSFIPEATDFESFVAVCRAKGTTLLLKTFLQAYRMQFIFSSYPYFMQRRIVRLLLGLSPDGEFSFWSAYDLSVILKRPY